MENTLDTHIESLIFVAKEPVKREDIKYNLENALEITIQPEELDESLQRLQDKYWDDNFAIEIVEVAEGFQFVTKGKYHHAVGYYLRQLTKKRLSKVALETLAIVAYRQPVSRAEIEQIRGVNADYAIDKLLEKELIEISGRSTGPGKPLLYVTSAKFMDYFGLKSMEDLPQLKEFHSATEEIGDPGSMEEIVEVQYKLPEGDQQNGAPSEEE